MTTEQEWTYLLTMKDVANVPEGWEIMVKVAPRTEWEKWYGVNWKAGWMFRARPRQPKTKTITLQKAWVKVGFERHQVVECDYIPDNFVCWLGEPYTVLVPA